MFRRRRMSASEIVETLGEAITRFLPGRKTILTVSPVRHLGDGATENTLSKSTLILAAHALTESLPDCRYFPAYEILMDDLRDYRFYERDMVHPSETAVEYIWEAFRRNVLDERDNGLLDRAEALRRAMEHRPFDPSARPIADSETGRPRKPGRCSDSILIWISARKSNFSNHERHAERTTDDRLPPMRLCRTHPVVLDRRHRRNLPVQVVRTGFQDGLQSRRRTERYGPGAESVHRPVAGLSARFLFAVARLGADRAAVALLRVPPAQALHVVPGPGGACAEIRTTSSVRHSIFRLFRP